MWFCDIKGALDIFPDSVSVEGADGRESAGWLREADLNGVHDPPHPLWIQLVQGKEPLHLFFDFRQAVHAVVTRSRFAGCTLGRAMLVESKSLEVELPAYRR